MSRKRQPKAKPPALPPLPCPPSWDGAAPLGPLIAAMVDAVEACVRAALAGALPEGFDLDAFLPGLRSDDARVIDRAARQMHSLVGRHKPSLPLESYSVLIFARAVLLDAQSRPDDPASRALLAIGWLSDREFVSREFGP